MTGNRERATPRKIIREAGDESVCRDHEAKDIAWPGAALASWWLMARALREEMIGDAAVCDPPWYILLDLYRAHAASRKVQITSLSPMIGVPHSTAGRWARQLISQDVLVRSYDLEDRRRSYVDLSPWALNAMRAYFEELAARGGPPHQPKGTAHGPG